MVYQNYNIICVFWFSQNAIKIKKITLLKIEQQMESTASHTPGIKLSSNLPEYDQN